MDMNATAPGAGALPAIPPGMTFVAAVTIPLYFTIIATAGAALLIPMLTSLLFFSNSKLRRSLIFNLNVVLVVLGVVAGSLNVRTQVGAETHDVSEYSTSLSRILELHPLRPFS